MLKKLLSCCAGIFLLILILVFVALWQANRFWLQHPAKDAAEQTFTIESGTGFSAVANQLQDQGLIANAFWFKVFAKVNGGARNIQAGTFKLQPGDSYTDVISVLSNAFAEEIQITIPEGYTLQQIGETVIEKFGRVNQDEWDRVTGVDSPFEQNPFIVSAKKPDSVDLEGYLFPDTYRFYRYANAEDIVGKMLEEMQQNIEFLNPDIGNHPGGPQTIHEYLTLASIVQREVRSSSEMAVVAGIFYNRLEIGMPLQADSTVNYVIDGDSPSLTIEQTKLNSPYNTYQNAGLPPGPISAPGFSALKATAEPFDTNYFYFLTTPEGEVIYAETFEQHVANKNRYLR